jgi:hypothetical protein
MNLVSWVHRGFLPEIVIEYYILRIMMLVLSLAETSPAIIPMPGEGAVCPLIVIEEDRDTADFSTM